MTITTTRRGSTSEVIGAGLTGTARMTGLLHLGLAVTGALGFQFVRGQLYVADDPAGTLSNLVEHTAMARLCIVLELGLWGGSSAPGRSGPTWSAHISQLIEHHVL